MRNNFSKIAKSATLGLAITFTLSCSGSIDDHDGGGGGGSSLSDLPKQTYLDGSEYKGTSEIELRIPFYKGYGCGDAPPGEEMPCTCRGYDGVRHECSYEEANRYESKPAGRIQNGLVSLNLPENIDSKYFTRMKDEFCRKGNECSVSPENLTAFSPKSLAVTISGNSNCELLPALKKSGYGKAILAYMSQPGKITGKECSVDDGSDDDGGGSCNNYFIYDMNFSKGWNVLYLYGIDNWNNMGTTNLSKTGGTVEWQIGCDSHP